ncbi:hypothetical protein SANTM175S_10408 [Streptomyces antimycoticus]
MVLTGCWYQLQRLLELHRLGVLPERVPQRVDVGGGGDDGHGVVRLQALAEEGDADVDDFVLVAIEESAMHHGIAVVRDGAARAGHRASLGLGRRKHFRCVIEFPDGVAQSATSPARRAARSGHTWTAS